MQILVLVVSIIVVQYVISWAGSCLVDMSSSQIKYAYFYFSKDRHIPMTKNILMNIFIPNIAMVFLYDLYKYLGWEYFAARIWVFTLGFYLWRCFLICVILRRKEFYKLKYELGIAIVSVSISIIVFYSFLKKTESIFIQVDELREELGFAIIVALYGFVKLILDEKVTQKDVLKEKDLKKYILRKFNVFFERYKNIIKIDEINNTTWLLVFSIMIIEDFNRGPEKRAFEYILFPIRKKETLGIMQVKSERIISSKKSIQIAFDLINNYKEELGVERVAVDNIYDIATKYNEEERYGENVQYIYEVLDNYIRGNEYYKSAFLLEEQEPSKQIEQTEEIVCETLRKLGESLNNNKSYRLKKQTSDILDGLIDTKYLQVEQIGDGWEVVFKYLNNVKISGNGSHLFSHFKEANVIRFEGCSDIEISGFKLGHSVETNECCGSVIHISNSDNIVLKDMELYGCGTYGVFSNSSRFVLKNVNIHNCKYGAVCAWESDVEIVDGYIHNCLDETNNLIEVEGSLKVKNLEIYNNHANLAIIKSNPELTELDSVYIHDNKYRKNYFWSASENEILLKNNEQLTWS